MNKLIAIGTVLVILGVLGLAIPHFTTTQTKDVVNLGTLHVQTKEDQIHWIPPGAAIAVAVVGVVVLGGGLYRKT